MHHNPTRRCAQLDVGCAVGPTQRPCSKAHLAAVIVDDALLAILLNADAVPAYLPESSLPDPPSLTGPPCPLNDRNSQDSRLPSMVAGNSRFAFFHSLAQALRVRVAPENHSSSAHGFVLPCMGRIGFAFFLISSLALEKRPFRRRQT